MTKSFGPTALGSIAVQILRGTAFLIALCMQGCSSSPNSEPPRIQRQAFERPTRTKFVAPAHDSAPVGSRTNLTAHPNSRNARQSLLGKWVDGQGTVYNFGSKGLVTWSHPVGSTAANFEGSYTLTKNELVIVPKGASSPQSSLSKQMRGLRGKHRLADYELVWQTDGSLLLSEAGGELKLRPIR